MPELTIATRGSDLAMMQARWVAERLSKTHRELRVSFLEVTTTGDRDLATSVATLTEVGAFVRAVQEAVLDGRADIAVHSCKDLPVEGPEGLTQLYPRREVPWDVLCGHDLESLPERARVGTGSPRRAAQLRALRPDVAIDEIRGNVGTRLEKVKSGDYDAVVLAEAGLRRLAMTGEIRHRFPLQQMVPAPAQAALAVEVRDTDPHLELLRVIDDLPTRVAVEAERALLARTHAGCRSALGAYAETKDDHVRITGFVADESGARRAQVEGPGPEIAARRLQAALGL